LTLSGGWNGSFTAQIGKSVLNVNATNADQNRVLRITATNTAVSACVIRNGYLNTSGQNGAGIYVAANGATLQDLVVTNNICPQMYASVGGGICVINADGVRISRCKVVNNQGGGGGGGIYIQDSGETTWPTVVEYCDIFDNTTPSTSYNPSTGGGVHVGFSSTYSHVVLANCRIMGNRSRLGSAVFFTTYLPASRLTIFNCLIARNRQGANNMGGNGATVAGLNQGSGPRRTVSRIVNSTIAENLDTSRPGGYGIYCDRGNYGTAATMDFINSICFTNNYGIYVRRYQSSTQEAHVYFQRCTIKEQAYTQYYDPNTITTNSFLGALAMVNSGFHSRDDSGTVSQNIEGNIDGYPGFVGSSVDPAHPFRISPSSVNCVDNGITRDGGGFRYVDVNYNATYDAMTDIVVKGSPGSGRHLIYTTDLLGNQRLVGSAIDRGAYESIPPRGTAIIIR
ncbi:MAG: hypothetical protein N2255_05070, partial [Kiritimatiellae bacterium]|nr:hypothetical protein [Kiritimatiellia bacterium]